MAERDLVLYPGILIRLWVPPQSDVILLDEAIARIALDVEDSITRHLPAGCVAELQKIA
jgi:hypothetical protein